MSMFYLELPEDPTDDTLPNPLIADPILDGDNGGTVVLFDLAAEASWPSQAAPVEGDAVHDLAGGSDLTAKVTGTAPTFAGGGFDFTTITSHPNTVLAPAGVLGSIAAAADDYFLVCGYYRMPAAWNTSANLQALFCCTAAQNGYSTPEVDLVTIYMQNATVLGARRQTNGGATVDATTIANAAASHVGQVAQIAFWRNAAGQTLRIKSAAGGVQKTTTAVGANNSGDFSAKQPRWGRPTSFQDVAGNQRKDFRLYRGFIKDLHLDTRDPETMLNEDWGYVASRFS